MQIYISKKRNTNKTFNQLLIHLCITTFYTNKFKKDKTLFYNIKVSGVWVEGRRRFGLNSLNEL